MTHPFREMNLKTLEGEALDPSVYEGKALLIVNVASRCGFTGQYEALVALHEEMKAKGGAVIGVPCNQFGGQEPGTAEEIRSFCATTYGVDFPILEKQDVNGEGRSALYRHLVGSEVGGGSDIKWNFAKFVVDAQGEVRARFGSMKKPGAPAIGKAIAEAMQTRADAA
jgi:glutathione peroxidase